MVARAAIDAYFERVPEHVLTVLDEAYFEYVDDRSLPGRDRGIREVGPPGARSAHVLEDLRPRRAPRRLRRRSEDVVTAIRKVQNAFDVTQPAQDAALASLGDGDELARRRRARTPRAADQLVAGLEALGLRPAEPAVANFVYVEIGSEDARPCSRRCCARGVIVRPLAGFGAPARSASRVGTSEENELSSRPRRRVLAGRRDRVREARIFTYSFLQRESSTSSRLRSLMPRRVHARGARRGVERRSACGRAGDHAGRERRPDRLRAHPGACTRARAGRYDRRHRPAGCRQVESRRRRSSGTYARPRARRSASSPSTRRARSRRARCSATGSGSGDHFLDPGVFIRSMATRGHLGGVAEATLQAALVLDASGQGSCSCSRRSEPARARSRSRRSPTPSCSSSCRDRGTRCRRSRRGSWRFPTSIAVNKRDQPQAKTMLHEVRRRARADTGPRVVAADRPAPRR